MEAQIARLVKDLDAVADGLATGGNLEPAFTVRAAQQTIRTLWLALTRKPATEHPAPCPSPKE